MTRLTWDQYALNLAYAARTRSEDPYHQVGAVVMRTDNSVASVGYNGPPPGVDIDWSDRDNRRALVVHAEANALRYVEANEAAWMAVTMMPCISCVQTAAAYRIKRIVYFEELDPSVYDREAILRSADLCGIEIVKESE